MKRVIIIQARMTSTRLPGKVLMDIAGQPMLAWELKRLRQCSMADQVMIATTINPIDDPIVELAKKEKIDWFRGDEQDVLSRYIGAARQAHADVIVRVTADCPLIDPQITDKVIHELVDHPGECDYASNVIKRTFPRGLDVEVLFWDTLLRIDRLALSKTSREHVTVVLRSERPELFMCRSVTDYQDNSDLRWTVDTNADMQLILTLYQSLDLTTRMVPYSEILSYMRANPDLSHLNNDSATWDPISTD
jgi:spore coat polysaccharide biosynthesis protein SpsF